MNAKPTVEIRIPTPGNVECPQGLPRGFNSALQFLGVRVLFCALRKKSSAMTTTTEGAILDKRILRRQLFEHDPTVPLVLVKDPPQLEHHGFVVRLPRQGYVGRRQGPPTEPRSIQRLWVGKRLPSITAPPKKPSQHTRIGTLPVVHRGIVDAQPLQ